MNLKHVMLFLKRHALNIFQPVRSLLPGRHDNLIVRNWLICNALVMRSREIGLVLFGPAERLPRRKVNVTQNAYRTNGHCGTRRWLDRYGYARGRWWWSRWRFWRRMARWRWWMARRWMACGRLPRSSLRTSRFLCTSRAFLSAPPLRVLPTSPFLRCWCWPLCHRFVLDLGAYAIRLATNLGMWRAILLKAFGSRFAAAVVARSRMITISSLSVPKSESEKAQPPANKCPLVAFRPFSRSNAREMMLGTWVKYWFALRHSLVERGRCRWSRCAEQFERANPRMLTARGELRAESRRSN